MVENIETRLSGKRQTHTKLPAPPSGRELCTTSSRLCTSARSSRHVFLRSHRSTAIAALHHAAAAAAALRQRHADRCEDGVWALSPASYGLTTHARIPLRLCHSHAASSPPQHPIRPSATRAPRPLLLHRFIRSSATSGERHRVYTRPASPIITADIRF